LSAGLAVDDGADSAKTIQQLKARFSLGADWTEREYDGRKFIFALVTLPSDSASYIDLHAWVYNEHYLEWRRFLKVNTRHLGDAKLGFDNQRGILTVRGAANNQFNGMEVLRFDLRATSNDAAFNKTRRG
jgi:hypothetical protein